MVSCIKLSESFENFLFIMAPNVILEGTWSCTKVFAAKQHIEDEHVFALMRYHLPVQL